MRLEKCPFCGCKAILCSTGNQFATEKFFASCGVCGVETPRIARTRKEAIAAWNRRCGKDTNVATNAVPVVRCKECGHYDTTGYPALNLGTGWCDKMDRGVHDDFYCSYGERRK